MLAANRPPHKFGALIGWLLPVLFLLIPYLFAAVTGAPEEGLTGIARLHSSAESVYCEDGRTPVTLIFTALLALMLTAVIVATIAGKRIPAVLSESLQTNGWHVLTFMLLIAIPFFIAWQTESSVCSRGRAFFWQSIFIDIFILSILALSYNLMFGFAGVVSFGHAAFFGLGAYAVGLLMLHLKFVWWLAVLTALLIGVLIALIKGFVGLRIKGLYFALFTLAFAEVFFILAANRILVDITGAEDGFTFEVPDFLNVTQNRLFFYYLAFMAMVAAFLIIRRLMNSPTGRVLHALRENEERAQMLGYNTFYFKLTAIIIAGVLASGAGILRGIALKGASPNVLSLDFTITPLLMVIVGGLGTFAGPAVGAFSLHLLEQYLRDTIITIGETEINIGERWALILGLVFILIVMVFPQGIVGTWYNKALNTRAGWRRLLRLGDRGSP